MQCLLFLSRGTFSKKPPEFEQLLTVNLKEPVTGVVWPLVFALKNQRGVWTDF